MRLAIIDCGTNTFHLLVADLDNAGNYSFVYKDIKNVKLGKDTILNNKILPESMERGYKAIDEFISVANKLKSEKTIITATSAVRSADNGNVFVDEVFKRTAVRINVIDGDREADLIYKGVKLAMDDFNDAVLIMDIGGGSTEFILAKNDSIIYKHSFDLGVARLLQKFNPSDPITKKNINEIHDYFNLRLKPLLDQIKKVPVSKLVGCSGSFESLHSMIYSQIYNTPIDKEIKIAPIKENDFRLIYNKLLASTEANRLKMKGLIPMRVDTIVLASVFINYVITTFQINEVFYSAFALKEGVLAEELC